MLLGRCWMRVLQSKQLDVNNFFMKECSLRAGVILPLRFLLIGRGTQGDVLEKPLGFTRNSKVARGVGGSRVFN
jgi:hypothetical protein